MTRAILAAALTLAATSGPCRLESANVEFIEPATWRVLTLHRCPGDIACWTRFIETAGERMGESRACEAESGDRIVVDPMGEQK